MNAYYLYYKVSSSFANMTKIGIMDNTTENVLKHQHQHQHHNEVETESHNIPKPSSNITVDILADICSRYETPIFYVYYEL